MKTKLNKEHKKVSIEHSCQIRSAYQLSGIRGKELLRMFPQYCKAAIYKHAKKPINGDPIYDKRKSNKGRPNKLSLQDDRNIIRSVHKLRLSEGSFTSRRVQTESGVLDVSNRTIRRVLNKHNYFYLRSRKKGLLTKKDLKKRLKFCRNIIKINYGPQFWNNGIAFYLDGKGFEFKTNPLDQARAPTAREWRKISEGLSINCVAKGKKEGVRNANFMIAISHGKGVVMCTQYHGRINGEKFARIVKSEFPTAFSISEKTRTFLMDGCPRQNSKVAKAAIERVGGMIFSIPARSPDLNPIENFFNIAQKRLKKEAISKKITKETFEQFSERVKNTVMSFSAKEIDKIIETMDKRIKLVIKAKGQRIKY